VQEDQLHITLFLSVAGPQLLRDVFVWSRWGVQQCQSGTLRNWRGWRRKRSFHL